MNNYQIEKINDVTYLFNDKDLCTSYLIIGNDKALLIDTGMASSNNLYEEIRKYTNKEIIVVLTHGHIDHVGHLNEFKNFYVSEKEIPSLEKNNINLDDAILFKKNQGSIDLGNLIIDYYLFEGHTKGSTIFIDRMHNILFTGDQFGSGCGVWMQVNEACNISLYKENIILFLKFLNDNYKDIDWDIYGGHYGQEKTSRLGYNKMSMETINNMITLCDLLLENKVDFIEYNGPIFSDEKSYYVNHKKAEMVIRKSLIK